MSVTAQHRVENTLMRDGQLYNGVNFVNVFQGIVSIGWQGKKR